MKNKNDMSTKMQFLSFFIFAKFYEIEIKVSPKLIIFIIFLHYFIKLWTSELNNKILRFLEFCLFKICWILFHFNI